MGAGWETAGMSAVLLASARTAPVPHPTILLSEPCMGGLVTAIDGEDVLMPEPPVALMPRRP
jgi:hypothetical protein